MKSQPVLKKIKGKYYRRLLPTETVHLNCVYADGTPALLIYGQAALSSVAYGACGQGLWAPMPEIEGYRQLDLSDALPQAAKVACVHEDGRICGPLEYASPGNEKVADALRYLHSTGYSGDALFYAKIEPKIAEGHNPDKLTEEQVGVKDGWRLLLPEEIGHRPTSSSIYAWGANGWGNCFGTGYRGHSREMTYRVRQGVKLDPAPDTNERLKKLEEAVEALKFTVELQMKAITSLQNRLDEGGRALQG